MSLLLVSLTAGRVRKLCFSPHHSTARAMLASPGNNREAIKSLSHHLGVRRQAVALLNPTLHMTVATTAVNADQNMQFSVHRLM